MWKVVLGGLKKVTLDRLGDPRRVLDCTVCLMLGLSGIGAGLSVNSRPSAAGGARLCCAVKSVSSAGLAGRKAGG